MSATVLMASGAARLARAISAAGVIRYWSIGAMVGYGVAVLWGRPAGGRRAAHPITNNGPREFNVPLPRCRGLPQPLPVRLPNPRGPSRRRGAPPLGHVEGVDWG